MLYLYFVIQWISSITGIEERVCGRRKEENGTSEICKTNIERNCDKCKYISRIYQYIPKGFRKSIPLDYIETISMTVFVKFPGLFVCVCFF